MFILFQKFALKRFVKAGERMQVLLSKKSDEDVGVDLEKQSRRKNILTF